MDADIILFIMFTNFKRQMAAYGTAYVKAPCLDIYANLAYVSNLKASSPLNVIHFAN